MPSQSYPIANYCIAKWRCGIGHANFVLNRDYWTPVQTRSFTAQGCKVASNSPQHTILGSVIIGGEDTTFLLCYLHICFRLNPRGLNPQDAARFRPLSSLVSATLVLDLSSLVSKANCCPAFVYNCKAGSVRITLFLSYASHGANNSSLLAAGDLKNFWLAYALQLKGSIGMTGDKTNLTWTWWVILGAEVFPWPLIHHYVLD